ncbi:MAG: hypothetical protein LUC45_08510 [Paraprevotella sp.]|nr:hypothetical protein [Paraprevotella sp.]
MLNEETRGFIMAHREEEVCRLALKTVPDKVDLHAALQQIEGWQTAVHKLPSWAGRDDLWYPPRISMEQCSSESTARYKREVVRRWLEAECIGVGPRTMMDLTGGFGIDFSFLAVLFDRAVYMERQEELCLIASHNFQVLGLGQAEVRHVDSALAFSEWPEVDFCFADPARRNTVEKKIVTIEDCEPNLGALQEHIREKSRFCLVKLSPMLDIQVALRTLTHVAEVHAVSLRGECKELLIVLSRKMSVRTVFHCVNLETSQPDFSFTQADDDNAACVYADRPGRFLYEPNASVMKCGGLRCLAERYGLNKLHPNSHLYTSDEWLTDFPGRRFLIQKYCGFGKKELQTFMHDMVQANLTVRNFPSTVAELRKRLKIKEGGEDYLFATTMADGHRVLLHCKK